MRNYFLDLRLLILTHCNKKSFGPGCARDRVLVLHLVVGTSYMVIGLRPAVCMPWPPV
jgi:hypothetical protein